MTTGLRRLLLGLTVSTSLAFGQLDSNSVTVTVSRSVSLQPDQALFGREYDKLAAAPGSDDP
jgi:hypothetical protein